VVVVERRVDRVVPQTLRVELEILGADLEIAVAVVDDAVRRREQSDAAAGVLAALGDLRVRESERAEKMSGHVALRYAR
jgi:hypothetical protein